MTNKKCGTTRRAMWIPLLLSLGVTGCGPPGPRALLEGEKLIKEQRYAPAVECLRKATVLLPKDARAWNHLGLALQGNQQPEEAVRAYQTALALDHNLAAARYNLGCLHLDHGNFTAAVHELTSYALLQPANAEGWLRLGSAYLRSKSLAEAERCFKATLDLQPRHPEALNGLGLIQFQRRLWKDALSYFNLALTQNPKYGSALLNVAVVHQQGLNNRTAALKAYNQYLTSQPHNADWHSIKAIARQLDAELNPPPLVLLQPLTSPPAATRPSNPVTIAARPATNPPSPQLLVQVTRTPPSLLPPAATPPSATSPVVAVRPPPESPRAPPVTVAVRPPPEIPRPPPIVVPDRPPPETPRAATNILIAPITPIAPTAIRPPEISATFVSADLVIKPAQELVAPPPAASAPAPAPAPVPVSLPPSVSAPVDNSTAVLPSNPVVAPSDPRINSDRGKRSLISRLNPFGRKPRELDLKKAIPVKTNVMVAAATPVAVTPEPVPTAPPPPPMFPRYPYQSPVPPPSGNRTQADVAFSRGLKAHQAGNRKLAIDEYQAALRADPAYFDACYNLGLAAQDTGELGLALIAFETALALKPDSIDARYNFAIALKSGGYARDAFDQFEKILRSNPNEVRAHLSMANLCAQQLREPALARPHYETVLELKPGHAEATKIRLWLSNNP